MAAELEFLDMRTRDANNKPTRFKSSEYNISEKKNPKTGRITYMAIAKSPNNGKDCYRFVSKDFTAANK